LGIAAALAIAPAHPINRPAVAHINSGQVYRGPVTYADYVLRRPIIVGKNNRIAIVTTGMLNFRAPYRLDSRTGVPLTRERTAGVEWLHAGDWTLTAGYASTKPLPAARQLDPAFGISSNDVRVAKGLRIAAELLSGGGTAARQSVGLDARLQRVRIQDSSLIDAGEKLGEARLAIVFKHSW
jgi:hypothetical protein